MWLLSSLLAWHHGHSVTDCNFQWFMFSGQWCNYLLCDQMIEAPNNLACLQHGADPKYIQLHAQTQQELWYYLKHKYGISTGFNTNNATHPWYGMGQGAGDACNQWVIGSDSLANAYLQKANGWTIDSTLPQEKITQHWKAFIDDMNLFVGKPEDITEEEFIQMAQSNINRWHRLLWTTGGELNTKKCFWSDFNLQYNQQGNPISIKTKTDTDPQLYLTNHNGTRETLKTTKPEDGICHLGIHISMNGNSTTETQVLFKRCKLFQKVYAWCPFTQKEAEAVYTTIFLPTITYPFPATTLSAADLEKAQSMTMPTIISHMGYNCNMPKAVIYAPSTHGGIGLKHLHNEQGLQKVLQVIKHMHTRTTLSKLIQVTIQAHQLQAGIPEPILENNIPLPWLPNWWITNMREFLHSINGSIILEKPWTILSLHQHNRHLMQDFLNANLPMKDLQTLNNCRLYLQVTTLAELTMHDGICLLEVGLQCGKNFPSLKMTSQSLLKWPNQPNPSKKAWYLWTQTIQSLYTKPGTNTLLKQALGLWNTNLQVIHQWYATYDPHHGNIITKYPNEPHKLYQPAHTTRSHQYYQQGNPTDQTPLNLYPVTPKQQKDGFRITLPIPQHHQETETQPPPTTTNIKQDICSILPTYAPKLWSLLTRSSDPS